MFLSESKFHLVINLVKYCPYNFNQYIHIAKNINIATGNINSIIVHNFGINIDAHINNAFILIAKVNGIDIRVTSSFEFLSFWNSSVFLNLIYFDMFFAKV